MLTSTENAAPKKTRPAPKPKAKSKTPLLDAAKKNPPHAAGWDKVAAQQLAVEMANQTTPQMPLVKFLELANIYKDVAGWKNCLIAAGVKHGVINSRKFAE